MILNYDSDEGEIISSINIALGGDWWEDLSNDAQEKVHDALYLIMNNAKNKIVESDMICHYCIIKFRKYQAQ